MLTRIEIPGLFPSLNEYTTANRSNPAGANAVKHAAMRRVIAACNACGAQPVETPADVCILWVEESRRRDWDNVTYAAKFILDGLKEAGVIPDDSQAYIPKPAANVGAIDKSNPRVVVLVAPHDPRTLNMQAFGEAIRKEIGYNPWNDAGRM